MEDIEETDELRENEYFNDGFDDVDCDVDDLMNTKGRIKVTGDRARTVDEELSNQKDVDLAQGNNKEEESPLDFSDFFADDATSNNGEAVMQLKSVPVLKQDSKDEDYDTNIFPLPYSERRAAASPQVEEAFRLSRSSNQKVRAVSPIVNPHPVKLSNALSKKIASKSHKKKHNEDISEPSLPSIVLNKPKKVKKKARDINDLEQGSVASARDAAKANKLPHINKAKNKDARAPIFKNKRNKDDIGRAKEKHAKAKGDRMALAGGRDMADFHGRKQQDPVSPRINFKYDARLGLFGFDIEAERQSKRENYELMRIAKRNEEIAELSRARARVVYGAGVMDAKTIMPSGFSKMKSNQKAKPKTKPNAGKPARSERKLRSKSDFGAESKIANKARDVISSDNNYQGVENKNVNKARGVDGILLKYKENNLDAMQCSPVTSTNDTTKKNKKKVGVMESPEVISDNANDNDFYYDDGADFFDDQHEMLDAADGVMDRSPHEEDHNTFQEVLNRKGATPPPSKKDKKKVKAKMKISPLKLSGIVRKQQEGGSNYVESSAPSPPPFHDKPSSPLGDKKDSFQRKPLLIKKNNNVNQVSSSPRHGKMKTKSPRKSARKKSPRRRSSRDRSSSSKSPGKVKQRTKFDVDVFDSVSESVTTPTVSIQSPGKDIKKKNSQTKKSIADELFEEFEAFSVNSSPSPTNKLTTPKRLSPPSVASRDEPIADHSPKKSARKGVTKGKAKVKDPPSPRASQSKKKKPSPREKPGGSVETSSAAYSKKDEVSTSAEVDKVAECTTEYDDDYEVYDDEEFDNDGAHSDKDDDVLFDFNQQSDDEDKLAAERKAKEVEKEKKAAELKAVMEARERREAEELEKKVQHEKEIALAKEQSLKKEKQDEEERLALVEKQKKEEAEKIAQDARDEEIRKEKLEREQAARERMELAIAKKKKEKEEADRLAAEEEAKRREAQAKEEESERLKRIELVKEEKLEKAAQLEKLSQQEEHANAPAKSKSNDDDDDDEENYDDDYNFEDEQFEDDVDVIVDNETTNRDASSPVLFEINHSLPSPGQESTSNSQAKKSPTKKSSPSMSAKSSPEKEPVPDNHGTIVEAVHNKDEDNESKRYQDDDDDDVLFDFNKPSISKENSPVKVSTESNTFSPTNVNKLQSLPVSYAGKTSPVKSSSVENEVDEDEDVEEDDYASDYDDDFD